MKKFGYEQPKAQNAKDANEYTEEDAEKDKQPSKLELLLADSKFSCGQKKDGYYADTSVAVRFGQCSSFLRDTHTLFYCSVKCSITALVARSIRGCAQKEPFSIKCI